MAKSFTKSSLRSLRTTISRFLAIFAIVALGVGFLAGLLAAPADMRLSAEDYYDSTHMYDARVLSTQGLTEDDLEAVKAIPGVEAVMPVKDADLVLLSPTGDTYTARVHTLPEGTDPDDPAYLNQPVLEEGRLPTAPGECLVLRTRSYSQESVQLGDVLTLGDQTGALAEAAPQEFTIVGFAKSSLYLSLEAEHTNVGSGTLNMLLYTPESSFDLDYYTGFYLSVADAAQLNSFGTTYEDTVTAVTDQLDAIKEQRAQLRHDEIVIDANEQLADAKVEYNDAKAEADEKLADAEVELADGRKEVADAEKKLADAKKELDDGAAELATQRANLESQLAEPRKKIADGWAAYNDGMATLESGAAQLADGQKQVDEGYATVKENEATLDAQEQQLTDINTQLTGLESGKTQLWSIMGSSAPTDRSDASALTAIDSLLNIPNQDPAIIEQLTQLKAGLEAINATGKTTEQARTEWQAGKDAFDAQEPAIRQQIAEAKATLDATQAVLNQKSAELAAGQDALHDARKSLEAGEAEIKKNVDTANVAFAEAETKLADGRTEYEKGVTELADGKKDLAEGETEYADKKAEAEQKLADAEIEIADAEQEIANIEPGEWYVFDRSGNTSFASYGSNADKIANIAKVFPVFFFLVAALVALTTMTRMVEEERGQIGTLKALGYSRQRIAGKYLGYAAIASICGSVFGMTFGMKIFPALIVNAYNIMYDVPQVLTPFHASYGLLAAGVAVACTLAATLNACWAVLRENPARLMLPKAPKAGKRIFLEYLGPIWRRMKFTHKVTARNLFLYKKRFFMTVIGISGCTALLLTGFGVRDSISHIVTKQFDELYQYQLIIGVDDEEPLPSSELATILGDEARITDWMPAMQNNGEVVPEKGLPKDSVTIFVPESVERLPDYFRMRHRTTGEAIPFDEASVVITEKLAERQKLQVGDTITVKNHNDVQATLTITDICENYVNHAIYLSPAAYQDAFGEEAKASTVLCKLPEAGQDTEALSSALLECPEVQGVQFTTELSASFEKTLSSIDTIVMVLIVCAAALAFVVLYNLTNINIAERAKEIATIKVLGFYDGEVSAYIYRETALLSLIGAVAGLGLGVVLHQFVIRTAEVDMVMFGRTIDPPSYLYSLLLTLLFSAIVSAVMYRKLKKINMVDSMKAPE